MPDASSSGTELILVSACLLGVACRYDGQSCPEEGVRDLAAHGRLVPICPEVAGGLPTPRPPAEIEGAAEGLDGEAVLTGRTRVVRRDGTDVSAAFIAGAEAALALARRLGLRRAILKADSPSCGVGRIHNGRFDGRLVSGDGVTAALLKQAGIDLFTERDLPSRLQPQP
ncbi:MAG TPA: DUF523 domain-containing protein [Anaerolineae bacterium]|nr:DUF523 domain-containing protein [Anaerolineae bacterium]